MRRVGDDEWFSCCLFCCTGASPGNKPSKKPKLSSLAGSSRQLGVSTWQDNEEDEDDAESFECECAVPDKSVPNWCSVCDGLHSED